MLRCDKVALTTFDSRPEFITTICAAGHRRQSTARVLSRQFAAGLPWATVDIAPDLMRRRIRRNTKLAAEPFFGLCFCEQIRSTE